RGRFAAGAGVTCSQAWQSPSLVLPSIVARRQARWGTRKLGRFPPRMHYQATPDSRAAPHFARSHLAEAVAKAKAGGSGGGNTGGTGRGLVGQIIPIYGFGIFLYILYILFKLALDRQRQESELGELVKHREHKRNR
uniref:Resistance to inhibitors of cholinesterase protein 3 N-terminal domain-containing protein n=1 Tax=Strix occidentalis caurina TaxID=311401 RepID=A0A8D0F238_STROC